MLTGVLADSSEQSYPNKAELQLSTTQSIRDRSSLRIWRGTMHPMQLSPQKQPFRWLSKLGPSRIQCLLCTNITGSVENPETSTVGHSFNYPRKWKRINQPAHIVMQGPVFFGMGIGWESLTLSCSWSAQLSGKKERQQDDWSKNARVLQSLNSVSQITCLFLTNVSIRASGRARTPSWLKS